MGRIAELDGKPTFVFGVTTPQQAVGVARLADAGHGPMALVVCMAHGFVPSNASQHDSFECWYSRSSSWSTQERAAIAWCIEHDLDFGVSKEDQPPARYTP